MKNYEEMARDVFQRINEYETEKKAKRAKITKVAASVTPVCAAAVVGVGLWKGGVLTPDRNQLISSTVDSTVSDSDIFLSADNDTSENNSNINNKKNGADTSSILSTSNTTDSTRREDSRVDSTPVEDDSTTIENNNAAVVDTSQITNYEPQTITEEPSVQQTNPVTQTEPVEPTVTPAEGGNSGNSWCVLSSRLELNDTTYYDNDMADISAYTKDRYIGKVSDFNGEYSDAFNYRISPDDSVYTVKETDTVLFVVKADINSTYGAVIVMSSPDWSLDKYEPERLDPGYVDPNASFDEGTVVFNGFCQ